MIYRIRTCRLKNWQSFLPYIQIVKVVCDWWQINWSDHVMLNRNAPSSKPAINYFQNERDNEVGLRGKHSPQIRIIKGLAIDPIYQIMLTSTIQDQSLNSYCAKLSSFTICHVRNLGSCEFWSIKKWKWLKIVIKLNIWRIKTCWI